MKTGYTTALGWMLICCAALLSSCDIDDDNTKTSRQYRLTVKAIDPDAEDIVNNLYLYLFGTDDKLEKVVKCSLDQPTAIDAAFDKNYKVVAMGFSDQVVLPDVPIGTPMSQAKVVIPTTSFDNIIVTPTSGDILYGELDVAADCQDVNQTIWIRRKVAALTIITRNLQKALNTTDTDFNYVVGQTYGTFGFNGQFGGAKIAYHPGTIFTQTNKDFVAPQFFTYPTQGSDSFTIAIYKGTALLKVYAADSDQIPLILKEGKQTIVWIDFNSSDDINAFLDVTLQLKDWSDDDINEGFN